MIKILFEVLSVIFPVISITALGYFWNKIGNTINQKELIKFIAWIGAPCLVFDSLINLDSTYAIVSSITFGAGIMIFGMLLISFALLKIYNLNIKNVENIEMNTFSEEQFFYSYRRSLMNKEKDYGRCISVILMT